MFGFGENALIEVDANGTIARVLRADDPLIDMNYITSFTGMTDKWFYKLISEGHFPKPIKLGRSSRWYKSEVEQWMQQRIEESRGAAA